MNGIKSLCDNSESTPDNIKKVLLLYGGSQIILEAIISYIKNSEGFSRSLFE